MTLEQVYCKIKTPEGPAVRGLFGVLLWVFSSSFSSSEKCESLT